MEMCVHLFDYFSSLLPLFFSFTISRERKVGTQDIPRVCRLSPTISWLFPLALYSGHAFGMFSAPWFSAMPQSLKLVSTFTSRLPSCSPFPFLPNSLNDGT